MFIYDTSSISDISDILYALVFCGIMFSLWSDVTLLLATNLSCHVSMWPRQQVTVWAQLKSWSHSPADLHSGLGLSFIPPTFNFNLQRSLWPNWKNKNIDGKSTSSTQGNGLGNEAGIICIGQWPMLTRWCIERSCVGNVPITPPTQMSTAW